MTAATASRSVEDYLKAILEIGGESGRASTALLAKRLNVAPASVTGMLGKLDRQEPRWIVYEKHRGATLTPNGRKRALEVVRNHRLVELFLHHELGYSLDEVHEEAERLEHVISPRLGQRIARKLGHPEWDPHGHPIPTRNGTVPKRDDMDLLLAATGSTIRVSSVSDEDPLKLRHLASLGLVPQRKLTLVSRGDSSIIVRAEDSGELTNLNRDLALSIRVVLDPGKIGSARRGAKTAARTGRLGKQG